MTQFSLDPRRDCALIARDVARVAFPWDTTRALELALFRTFASPRIGGLLHATAEFETRAQKRYDDTDLIVSEMIEHGYDSDRGRRAIARMNEIHSRFKIADRDFLYVLSTFVLEPIRWNARFGWRAMTEDEKLGWFWFWHAVGERMKIAGLPASYGELERYNLDYERDELRFTEANRRVALATREMFAGWFPAPLRPLVRRSIHALLDPNLLTAFGLEPAPQWLVRTTGAALRARARVLRWLPKRRRVQLRTEIPRADYPNGYRIESLGPPPSAPRPRRSTIMANENTAFDGGCTCRAVRYRLTSKPMFVNCCHCRWCQRETGTAFALNAMIESERVVVLAGALDVVNTPSNSGKGQKITRCPTCRIALWSNYGGAGDLIRFVRVGTLDEPDRFPPDIHIFTASKQPWVLLPPGVPAVPEYYRTQDHWPAESYARREAALARR